jgi:hypothetical protein
VDPTSIHDFRISMLGYIYQPKLDTFSCVSWPGKLDVTVGGGMGLGHSAMSIIIQEEALLDSDYVSVSQSFSRRMGSSWPGDVLHVRPPDGSITLRMHWTAS